MKRKSSSLILHFDYSISELLYEKYSNQRVSFFSERRVLREHLTDFIQKTLASLSSKYGLPFGEGWT